MIPRKKFILRKKVKQNYVLCKSGNGNLRGNGKESVYFNVGIKHQMRKKLPFKMGVHKNKI